MFRLSGVPSTIFSDGKYLLVLVIMPLFLLLDVAALLAVRGASGLAQAEAFAHKGSTRSDAKETRNAKTCQSLDAFRRKIYGQRLGDNAHAAKRC